MDDSLRLRDLWSRLASRHYQPGYQLGNELSGSQNYRTELGVQKYGILPYLCTPPWREFRVDSDACFIIHWLFYN